MTDYYSILRKAVADRYRPSEAERHEIYQHARRTVLSQLHAAEPPWPDADIDRQIAALDAAIARLESEIEDEHGPPPPPERASQDDRRVERALQSPDGEPIATPRRRTTWAILGASMALLLTGLGVYWLVARDADVAPRPNGPAEPLRSAAVEPQRQADAAADPPQASYVLRKQHVYYRTTHPPGTVMISRNQKFLYVVQPNQVAIRYAIGVGPDCVNVAGLFHITDKVNRLDPGEARLGGGGASRKGDVEPRLGARIIYFGDGHAVHGTTEPAHIGESASFGCFHQWKQDIVDLYNRVPLNERVVVAN